MKSDKPKKSRITRRSIPLSFGGEVKTLHQWAEDLCIPYQTLRDRYTRALAVLPVSKTSGRVQMTESFAQDILRRPSARAVVRGDPLKHFSDDEVFAMQLFGNPGGDNPTRVELRSILRDPNRRGRLTHALREHEERAPGTIPKELLNLTDTLAARMGEPPKTLLEKDPFHYATLEELQVLKEAAHARGMKMSEVRKLARNPATRDALFKRLSGE